MVKSITLTASMRSNLNSLKNISKQMNTTQERLSTGKKVNSAIDNASSYYQARALTNRASDLDALLDAMGQGIQIIQAATQGLTSGASFLEQASAVANEALSQIGSASGSGTTAGKSIEDYIAEGYTAVGTEAELQAAIAAGTKVVLSGDITLTTELRITAANVTLDGNGHKISYTATESGKSAIEIDGTGNSATINNLKITASGEKVAGIRVLNGGKLTLDNTYGITVSGTGAQMLANGNAAAMEIFDGQTNTKAILDQIGNKGLAANAVNQFYVGDKNGTFGQGNWYLPSIGEWMEFYGTDTSQMTNGYGATGAKGDSKNLINAALNTLAGKGVEAEALGSHYYWSSSERESYSSWIIYGSSGNRSYKDKYSSYPDALRCSQLLKDCFNPLSLSAGAPAGGTAQAAPKVGDVMYEDKTWGSAADYDGSKKVVGVIAAVSEDGRDATIINLKDLTFSSYDTAGNFDPDNPYGGARKGTQWTTNDKRSEDITGIQNFNRNQLLAAIQTRGEIEVTNTASADTPDTPDTPTGQIDDSLIDQYNKAFEQYDKLINDSSYQGVNLLNNEKLDVVFNETRNNKLTVQGKDMSSTALGLSKANWTTQGDIANSIQELLAAVNKIRTFQAELGNNYTIIQTRQNFTESLTDVLETGADNLVLADMNEESANYLALQTRQQLATNALSLAANSAQSVLALFG
ncbi:MAG: flagellin [bacterium]|nr:flagellin [bacterium]MDY2830943.1 flagellin [Alphaproteobacteria bacterium]